MNSDLQTNQPSASSFNHLKPVLIIAFLITLIVGIVLYSITSAYVLRQAEKNIQNLLLSHRGIHLYIQKTMHPSLYKLQDEGEIPRKFYAPEMFSSSFIVRTQHQFYNDARKEKGLPELYYKMAADNPRNPVNKADEMETKLIKMFNDNNNLDHFTDIAVFNGKRYLYYAIPFLTTEERCLKCHGKREDAPIQLQNRYLGDGGFHDNPGKIRAIESIRAPIEEEYVAVYVITGAIISGLFTILLLFFFNKKLKLQVMKRTENLNSEIIARSKAEEKLYFTQFAVDNLSDSVFFLKEDGSLIYVNDNACKRLGYNREELLKLKVWDFDPNFPKEAWPSHWTEVKTKKTFKFESLHRTKDGIDFPVEILINYVEYSGNSINCGFVRDISERKALEQQVRQSQKIKAIGDLASGIAHDFNNILTPILGYAGVLKDSLPGGSKFALEADQILQAALRAKDLVKRILSFSRDSEEQFKPIKVQYPLKEALNLLRATFPSTIEFKEEIDFTAEYVLGDSTLIHQIVMNMGTNSLHAMKEKGGIFAVSLKTVRLQRKDLFGKLSLEPGTFVRIVISDTGHGIDSSYIERIFDPYFSLKKKDEGTGLGLSIVLGIVKRMGGDISVYSEVGKGSTFNIYLPLMKINEDNSTEIYASAYDILPTGTERILYVDDDIPITKMMKQILESLGYKVSTHNIPEGALQEFNNNPNAFDLVITDLTMPKITGIEFSRSIISINPNIPIIMCTGFSDLVNADTLKSIGIRECIMKPITKKEIAHIVRRILDKK
ncbi:MAG: multi-sensor hybrid histidine kinase [uncultured bacterium]|nr:MAG: multi-sensor hybrid histidine kinase [uncultured bacterium]